MNGMKDEEGGYFSCWPTSLAVEGGRRFTVSLYSCVPDKCHLCTFLISCYQQYQCGNLAKLWRENDSSATTGIQAKDPGIVFGVRSSKHL